MGLGRASRPVFEGRSDEVGRGIVDLSCYDKQTRERLDPIWEELERFNKMGLYEYISRVEAQRAPVGKTMKVKWVINNDGTEECPEVRCRLEAQELGIGERLYELFAWASSLTIVKLLLSLVAERGLSAMLSSVTCAFSFVNEAPHVHRVAQAGPQPWKRQGHAQGDEGQAWRVGCAPLGQIQ